MVDGDSECATGVVVCKSRHVCVSLYGCVDVVMLSFGSMCENRKYHQGKKKRELHLQLEKLSFLPLDTVRVTLSYVSLMGLFTPHQ